MDVTDDRTAGRYRVHSFVDTLTGYSGNIVRTTTSDPLTASAREIEPVARRGVRLCDERLADVTSFFSAWLPLLVIVVFWGWCLQRVLRRPTKPVLKWMVIGSVVVIALPLFRNIYLYLELERRDRPVTADDLRIVTRTKALLQDDQVWNRNDDRECTDDESSGKRSLFCALQKATIEVLGEYDHRRVALQEVRFAIEDATRGQDFDHRLRDYNNLPQTKLSDIWRALDVATERMRARVPKQ